LDFVAAGDTDARRELRELVGAGGTPARAARAVPTEDATYSPRRYYVLTNAGKPVFSM
jgi:hypothetical protein